jgi:putative FmdB family regulatory protein
MPTYEYACEACKHEFEEFQSITAAPLKKCPKCGKPRLKRLIGTGGGVIFKGSGFYQTDYRSESYKKGAEAEKPKTDADSKKSDATAKSAETKSEPASAPKEAAPSESKPASSVDSVKQAKTKKAS